jgi:ABC-type nickel/cobalt efflux system permease component RcnA
MEATMEFIAECLVLSSHLLVGFWTLSRDLLDGLGFGIEYRVPHTTTTRHDTTRHDTTRHDTTRHDTHTRKHDTQHSHGPRACR